jgi:hypothetical protein
LGHCRKSPLRGLFRQAKTAAAVVAEQYLLPDSFVSKAFLTFPFFYLVYGKEVSGFSINRQFPTDYVQRQTFKTKIIIYSPHKSQDRAGNLRPRIKDCSAGFYTRCCNSAK